MAVDINKFDKAFKKHPNFKPIIEMINRSPLMVDLIDRLPISEAIVLGDPRKGTYYDPGKQIINIDRILVDHIYHSPDPDYLGKFVTGLAHELGHAVIPGGTAQTDSSMSLTEYVAAELKGEGIAVLIEYRAAKELNIPMWSNDDQNHLQQHLDALSAKCNGNISSPKFAGAAVMVSAWIYASENPSTAPNLNYKQFHSACYVLKYGRHDYTDEQIDCIDWENITPEDVAIQAEIPGQPREFVNPLPLLPSSALALAENTQSSPVAKPVTDSASNASVPPRDRCISVSYLVRTGDKETRHNDVYATAQHFKEIDSQAQPAVFRVERFENGRQNQVQVAGTTRAFAPIGQTAFVKTVKAVDPEFRAALTEQPSLMANRLGPSVDSLDPSWSAVANRPASETTLRQDNYLPQHRCASSNAPSFNGMP